MKRAYTPGNVEEAKFNTIELAGEWQAAIGHPQLTGSWFIYGPPKNGKTSFAMKLSKYLSQFGRVAYNSVEEGLSLTTQMAMRRVNMKEARTRFILLDKENVDEMTTRLKRQKSPDIIVVDSIQFLELKFSEYKKLKKTFPGKLFIYISHIEGKQPEGPVARKVYKDANVTFRIEGFKAFPVSRFEGGQPITICEEKAAEYWGLENQ